jgi:hypothetical protein
VTIKLRGLQGIRVRPVATEGTVMKIVNASVKCPLLLPRLLPVLVKQDLPILVRLQ